MIAGLDHVAVAVRDLGAAVEAYRRLLGREPEGTRFGFPNAALQLVEGEAEGLATLAFSVPDLAAAARLAERRGLGVELRGGAVWLEVAAAGGLQLVLVETSARPAETAAADAVAALDHVVVMTPNPDRALAVYGAKLGLDLRLDRENPQWGARQLFFRAGDAVVEIGAKIGAAPSDKSDRFGGLAWRVADPEAAQARMAAAGFDVSEVRSGRKPGTRVFSVRDAPAGVPTLMIQPSPALESA